MDVGGSVKFARVVVQVPRIKPIQLPSTTERERIVQCDQIFNFRQADEHVPERLTTAHYLPFLKIA
jgi:hypothetical protein